MIRNLSYICDNRVLIMSLITFSIYDYVKSAEKSINATFSTLFIYVHYI